MKLADWSMKIRKKDYMKIKKEYHRLPFELFPAKFYPGLITLVPLLQESSIPQSTLAVVPRIFQSV